MKKYTKTIFFCLPVQKNIFANPFFECATSFWLKITKVKRISYDWNSALLMFFCKTMRQEEPAREDDDEARKELFLYLKMLIK